MLNIVPFTPIPPVILYAESPAPDENERLKDKLSSIVYGLGLGLRLVLVCAIIRGRGLALL